LVDAKEAGASPDVASGATNEALGSVNSVGSKLAVMPKPERDESTPATHLDVALAEFLRRIDVAEPVDREAFLETVVQRDDPAPPRPKGLIVAALFCLAAANAVPAFELAGDTLYGWQASWMELPAVALPSLERGYRPASVLGIIANLGFLTTLIVDSLRRSKLAKRIAITAAASAFGSVAFLATGSESFVPYPGCVLWLATGVLLVMGSTDVASIAQQPGQPGARG